MHREPLRAFLMSHVAAVFRELVVLAPAPHLGVAPLGEDQPIFLQAVEHRVEHPLAPQELPSGKLLYPLDQCVAIAVTFSQK